MLEPRTPDTQSESSSSLENASVCQGLGSRTFCAEGVENVQSDVERYKLRIFGV